MNKNIVKKVVFLASTLILIIGNSVAQDITHSDTSRTEHKDIGCPMHNTYINDIKEKIAALEEQRHHDKIIPCYEKPCCVTLTRFGYVSAACPPNQLPPTNNTKK